MYWYVLFIAHSTKLKLKYNSYFPYLYETCAGWAYVKLTQTRGIRKEETSMKKMPP